MVISRARYQGPLWSVIAQKLTELGLTHPDPTQEAWLAAFDKTCDMALTQRMTLRAIDALRPRQGLTGPIPASAQPDLARSERLADEQAARSGTLKAEPQTAFEGAMSAAKAALQAHRKAK